MMVNRFRPALLVAAAITLLAVPGTAQQDLSGTYSATLSADDVKLPAGAQIPSTAVVGIWSITFGPDSTYSVKQDDVEHVTGKYTMDGDEIQFNDASGDFACKGGDAPEGVYRLKTEGATLTFTKVKDDECPGRVATLTPKPFTAVR
jgi:hypothetical protein